MKSIVDVLVGVRDQRQPAKISTSSSSSVTSNAPRERPVEE